MCDCSLRVLPLPNQSDEEDGLTRLAAWMTPREALVGAALAAALLLASASRRRRRRIRLVIASTTVARKHIPAISRLIIASFPGEAASAIDDEDDVLSVLAGFHEVDECEWLLAIDEHEEIVGMAMVVQYHDSLYVASLCVLPARRGKGVGSRLMRSASALAAQRGLPSLSGSVFGGSERLVRFYQSLGGQLEAGHSVAAPGSPQPAQRLRARAGPATALGEPPPSPPASPPAVVSTCTL